MNVIGLDIGATKITGVVFNKKNVIRELTVPTPGSLRQFKQRVARLVELLSAGMRIQGLGVGQPGIVSEKSGRVESTGKLKYLRNFNLKKFYRNLGAGKVAMDNDAHCFALAEAHLGRGREFKNFIGITLGTGIGGGIVLNYKLFSGQNNRAGHVGHVMADLKNDSEYYYQMARDKRDFKKMAETLGILFANIINTLDVDAIVLGGTVALVHHKKFVKPALAAAKKHVVGNKALPKILVSNLKNSGALGAALLHFEKP